MPRKNTPKRNKQNKTPKRKRKVSKKKSKKTIKKPKNNEITITQFIENIDKILRHENNRYFLKISAVESLKDKIQYQIIKTHLFENIKPNYEPFKKHLKTTNAVKFYNLRKDAILIVPKPYKDRNYLTIYDFLKNSTPSQIKFFKEITIKGIEKGLKDWGKVYVNTHGLGVPYFHLRIDKNPKYY